MHTKEDIIEGVKCLVNTCHYHNEGNKCGAGKIEITPKNASTSEETDCNTFIPIQSIN